MRLVSDRNYGAVIGGAGFIFNDKTCVMGFLATWMGDDLFVWL
jgi:hypothetical protein